MNEWVHSIEHCLVSRSLIDIVIVYLLAKLHLSGGLTLSTNILTHTLSLHNLFEVPSYVCSWFIYRAFCCVFGYLVINPFLKQFYTQFSVVKAFLMPKRRHEILALSGLILAADVLCYSVVHCTCTLQPSKKDGPPMT